MFKIRNMLNNDSWYKMRSNSYWSFNSGKWWFHFFCCINFEGSFSINTKYIANYNCFLRIEVYYFILLLMWIYIKLSLVKILNHLFLLDKICLKILVYASKKIMSKTMNIFSPINLLNSETYLSNKFFVVIFIKE